MRNETVNAIMIELKVIAKTGFVKNHSIEMKGDFLNLPVKVLFYCKRGIRRFEFSDQARLARTPFVKLILQRPFNGFLNRLFVLIIRHLQDGDDKIL